MKNKLFLLFFISLFLSFKPNINAKAAVDNKAAQDVSHEAKTNKINDTKEAKNVEQKTVLFNYNNEDITNVINEIAALKCINVIFPQPPQKLSAKVSFTKYEEISINKAWNILNVILDIAGYSFVNKEKFYQIIKNENVTKEPLPVFVNAIDTLPKNDEKIRYVYFLNNLTLTNNSPSFTNLDQILKDMLPTEQEGSTYLLDSAANTLVISGRASTIRSIMKIVQELDKGGFRESLEVVPLKHTRADFISKIVSQIMPSEQEQQQYRYNPFGQKSSKPGATLFSEHTKIIPIDRTNSIAIFGQNDSVTKIREFIQKNLDLPIESERSVIHIKTLQYLNADDFAVVLQDLIRSKPASAQAVSDTSERDTLSTAIILAEKQTQIAGITATTQAGQPQSPTSTPVYGGNRLIVAARAADWQVINKLIDELDKPQLQVALEVLVVDISIQNDRAIGAQLRNRLDGSRTADPNFQTAHLSAPIVNFIGTTSVPTAFGLAADLLKPTTNSEGVISNLATAQSLGSTVISFENGNGISGVLSVLNNNTNSSILSQPYIITTNNQQANITIASTNLVRSGVVPQATGPAIIKYDYLQAALTVNILPRISSTENINLEILVNVNDFLTQTQENARLTTRQVKTNANIKNKEILVLGGLPRIATEDDQTETPILAKIPIIGSLFRNKSKSYQKNNLMIFICPTIIRPKLQGGSNLYTENKFRFVQDQIELDEIATLGSNFEKLRDPITRVFFHPVANPSDEIEKFRDQEIFIDHEKEKKAMTSKTSTTKTRNENYSTLKELIKDDENPLAR